MNERCEHEVTDIYAAQLRCVAQAPLRIIREAKDGSGTLTILTCRRHVAALVRPDDVIGTVS